MLEHPFYLFFSGRVAGQSILEDIIWSGQYNVPGGVQQLLDEPHRWPGYVEFDNSTDQSSDN